MNNNILFILFFILLIILSVIIIYNYIIDGNIEKFESIIVTERVPEESEYINSIEEVTSEINPIEYFSYYGISETSKSNTNTYSIISSYSYANSMNDVSLLTVLNYDNNSPIYLINDSDGRSDNYICIFFSQQGLILNSITINIYTDGDLSDPSSIIVQVINNKVKSQITTTNTQISNNIIKIVSNNYTEPIKSIVLSFPPSCKNVTLYKLDFMFNKTVELNYDTSSVTNLIGIPLQQNRFDNTAYGTPGFSESDVQKFIHLFHNTVPSFIFDFGTNDDNNHPCYKLANDGVTITSIQDIFGRFSFMTNISGERPRISKELDGNNNLRINGKYLQGTANTTLRFPYSSIPNKYTICCVTKYIGNTNNRRIITGENYNFLIGHSNGREGNIYNENRLEGKSIIESTNSNISRDWIISCVKSSGNGNKNIIINKNLFIGDGGNGDNTKRMIINNDQMFPTLSSDFGLKYLFIWDKVLSDDQLELVSNGISALMYEDLDFFRMDRKKLVLPFNDGLTELTAASNAKEIKQKYGTEKNGFYYINIPNKGPTLTYCIMDSSVYGGGWMLAMQGTGSTFQYSSTHWTTNTVLNQTNNTFTNRDGDLLLNNIIDAKYDVYNNMPVTDCLVLFPAVHTLNNTNIPNKPQYGWSWYLERAFGIHIGNTLLSFFANNYRNIGYTSVGGEVKKNVYGFKFIDYRAFLNGFNTIMPASIWGRQTQFMAFGLNYSNSERNNGHSHSVRIGASFNENGPGYDDTNDVSGGVGLANRSAGSRVTCCRDGGSREDYTMTFQLYIR